MDDKKNKIKLSAPSQFKPTRKAGGLTSASTTDPSRQLKTPSAFLQPQNETRKIPGKLSPRTLKRGSLDGQQLFVHEEVKKLEEQNRRLEQNITRQLQDIAANATQLKKSGGPIRQESPELKRVTALYEELCKEQRRNFEIQSSMQKQMEKQAAVIEKQTEQIACLQSESGNENERLRRKVQRLTEELKETKSYYEKEIEGKEKAQLTNLAELSKLKEQMYDLNVNYKKEVDSLGRELEQQKIDNRSLVKRMRTQQNEKEEIITQFNESRKNERQKFEVDFKQISDKLLEDQNALNNKISALSLSQKEKDNIISGLQSDFEKKENENNNLQLLLKQKGKDLSDLYHKVEQLTMENTHLSEQSQKMLKDKELNHKMLTEEKESQFNAKLVEIDKIRVGLQGNWF